MRTIGTAKPIRRRLWGAALACALALILCAAPPPGRADPPLPGGAYDGLDDYFIRNGLTGGYVSRPLPPMTPEPASLAPGAAGVQANLPYKTYLPLAIYTPRRETRAVWVSRFDLPQYPDVQTVQTIVDKVAYARMNTIIFQVRGQADALYQPGLEPWSSYLTGTLGKDPGWDPLAEMIARAHAKGIEVHAWINVYPIWLGTTPPLESARPLPLYYKLRNSYPSLNWMQWAAGNPPTPMGLNSNYLCGNPAHLSVVDRVLNVGKDLLRRYDLDGIHYDYIRYVDRNYSYDPLSQSAYADTLAEHPGITYAQWERDQVTNLVRRTRDEVLPVRPDVHLTTTAWPIYIDRYGWFNGYDGYSARYQDSEGWAHGKLVSAIVPMMYGPSFTNYRDRYEIMTNDFVNGSRPGGVIMGITGEYSSFAEIAWRIQTARAAGAWGEALFSYRLIDQHNYWQALRDGPYSWRAVPNWP